MLGKSKSKRPKIEGKLHPVLARAQESITDDGTHKLTTLTEKELQARIKENKKKISEKKRDIKRMENDKTFSPLQGVGGVLMMFALGWWALGQLEADSGVFEFTHYNIARIVLLLSMYILVIVTAFKMSFPQGFMCIMFPPYLLYFVFIPMESSALKGIILGLLIVGYFEYKQLEDDSVYAFAAQKYEWVTARGRDLLNVGTDKKYY
jgi:hypothetical protein